mmetsp:Transcript_18032/g.39288  ORF Transcript_18032/g.39288 Transcript_18032/m.39288 type:complete len:289 (-) Transcript_18032:209-1075(-)
MSTIKDTVPIAPQVESGFARNKKNIAAVLLLQTVVFAATYYPQKTGIFKFKPADKFCENHNPADGDCTRADLFAFQFAAGVMLVYLGIVGFRFWHFQKDKHPKTPEGRIYGFIQEGENVNVAIFCFQAWDFVASSLIPEHSSFIFMAHHFTAAMAAYFSLDNVYIHYYAIFFGGVSEFSSIFLVFCDLEVYFPAHMQEGSFYGMFILANQVIFATAFFAYRVFGWLAVSKTLWTDAKQVLSNGMAENLRPGKNYVLYLFLAVDVTLGSLQLLWSYHLILKVQEILAGP